MENTIVWARHSRSPDMDRARKFYGAVLQADVELMPGMTDVALSAGR